jgi:nucleotide-binding universal stress UspA family protein
MHSSVETNERRRDEKHKYLRDVANRIALTTTVKLETILIESADTEDSLVKATACADLVVMASRRRGLLRRLWSYSVADALRPRLRVPVLFVRGYRTAVDLTSDPIPRHILIPLDGSTHAERILDPAIAIGQLEEAKFTLVNVQNHEWTSGTFEHTNPTGYLLGIAQNVSKSVSAVIAQILTTDRSLTAALTAFAEGRKIDLIAIATRSDGGMTRLLRGSVTDQLIRRTDLPILLLGIDIVHKRTEVTTVAEYCRSSDAGTSANDFIKKESSRINP